MNLNRLHDNLREVAQGRINRGTMSVTLLSRKAGLCQSHVSNFIHGKRRLSVASMARVLVALGFTVEAFGEIRTLESYPGDIHQSGAAGAGKTANAAHS